MTPRRTTAPTRRTKDAGRLRARLRFVLEPDIALGPGKADMLEQIRETGSISAAGRLMGMSYKRAWLMVESMNRCFRRPLVEAAKGGTRGGGARLTPVGEEVLAQYRRMEAKAAKAIQAELRALQRLAAPPAKD
ncbi:MAG: LysR family transcriptional regulator [Rhodocyclales bacterium]|jgi:molybdate transport system regulatory protein|nr:MAG: LysR family transcriptional regulator [Rhodocyclales bacterium]